MEGKFSQRSTKAKNGSDAKLVTTDSVVTSLGSDWWLLGEATSMNKRKVKKLNIAGNEDPKISRIPKKITNQTPVTQKARPTTDIPPGPSHTNG